MRYTVIERSRETILEQDEINAIKFRKIHEEPQMSTIDVPNLQIKSIPALLGEVDVIKALQLLPVAQSGEERQGNQPDRICHGGSGGRIPHCPGKQSDRQKR